MVILVGGLRLFHIDGLPLPGILLLVAIGAIGNGLWYMLVTETVRLTIKALRKQHPRSGQ
jgi:hypothetical protein